MSKESHEGAILALDALAKAALKAMNALACADVASAPKTIASGTPCTCERCMNAQADRAEPETVEMTKRPELWQIGDEVESWVHGPPTKRISGFVTADNRLGVTYTDGDWDFADSLRWLASPPLPDWTKVEFMAGTREASLRYVCAAEDEGGLYDLFTRPDAMGHEGRTCHRCNFRVIALPEAQQ